jgi:micrococcal nuclease
MKSIFCTVAALAAFFACSNLVLCDERPVVVGRVVKIVDGDTIDVRLKSGPIRIRFHGVDAPEKAQDHGKEATTALSTLIMGKDVQVEPFQQDRYDRLVGIVYLGKLNVNAELVRNGHAWALRRYMRKADAHLCSLESQARYNHRGLWASAKAIAPWEYRRSKKSSKSSTTTRQTLQTEAKCVAAIGKPY